MPPTFSPGPKTWLSEQEVSDLTGISVSKLQKDRHFRRGIPYSKPQGARLVRYALEDVNAFLAQGRVDFATLY